MDFANTKSYLDQFQVELKSNLALNNKLFDVDFLELHCVRFFQSEYLESFSQKSARGVRIVQKCTANH